MTETALSSLKPLNNLELTRSSKYLLPTIFNDNSILENGFVNVYSRDVNRPWLDDHIFIVYESNIENGTMYKIMEKNSYYFDTKYIKVGSIPYTIYIFKSAPELKDQYRFIRDGNLKYVNNEVKKNIIQFWPLYLPELMSGGKYAPIDDVIPIEDEWVDPIDIIMSN